jgi:hypothetical protein
MDVYFQAGLPELIEAEKAEMKRYRALSDDLANARQKRTGASAKWHPLAATWNRLREQSRGESPDAMAASAAAVAVDGERCKIELDQITIELPIIERVISDFAPLYRESLRRAHRIRQKMVELAREHVTKIFHRDFPANVWPTNSDVLERHVAFHPIVLQAQASVEEVARDSVSHEIQQQAEGAAASIRRKIGELQTRIAKAKEQPGWRSQAAEAARRSADEDWKKQQEHSDRLKALEADAMKEAQRRINAMN